MCFHHIDQSVNLNFERRYNERTLEWRITFFSDWCAKLYEHNSFNGWEQVIPETDYGTPSHDDAVSSIKVRDGCTFKAYKHHNKGELLETLTNDKAGLEHNNNEVSSFSCSCIRKFTIKISL